ncbi:abortive infection AbiH-like protein [Brevibacterium sanguinis]|uniref:Abortive infection AbiH-like protein n=2 Tax=Brevibacterium TaxID=1696 RepID=A0A366IH78_9MICO|nr:MULTISPECIES: AbiH family protein [Brevibacterium]RBP64908.1 abortive infection AbiH-like protein [Brevibacterium sanguinis]RBP71171.1 abortive infection AbiH-like protein [Brevibacterium celere]
MGYRVYTKSEFADLRQQHNIMALVGNGFDIQVMREYKQPWDTRYETFYHYLKFRQFDVGNHLLAEMEDLRRQGKDDWSDLEAAIEKLLGRGSLHPDDVYSSLRDVQREFSSFLNQVASSNLLDQLGNDAMEFSWSVNALSRFVEDVDRNSTHSSFKFPSRTGHYDLYNFLFINFNYTPLLDGYVYLDQEQFDPHPFKYADRNFQFYPNPANKLSGWGNAETKWSSYVLTDIVHPHGYQGIPRSLLFGIDAEGRSNGANPKKKLQKPFWAQSDTRYAHLIHDTDLFILFGCSLGETDGWWWRNIFTAMSNNNNSEMIIYWWSRANGVQPSEDEIREKFLKVAKTNTHSTSHGLMNRIHVVIYDDSVERIWLNTSRSRT